MVVARQALFVLILVHWVAANPNPVSRTLQKRISDQRLSELQALVRLSKIKVLPVAFGAVDVRKAGKRRIPTALNYEDTELMRNTDENSNPLYY